MDLAICLTILRCPVRIREIKPRAGWGTIATFDLRNAFGQGFRIGARDSIWFYVQAEPGLEATSGSGTGTQFIYEVIIYEVSGSNSFDEVRVSYTRSGANYVLNKVEYYRGTTLVADVTDLNAVRTPDDLKGSWFANFTPATTTFSATTMATASWREPAMIMWSDTRAMMSSGARTEMIRSGADRAMTRSMADPGTTSSSTVGPAMSTRSLRTLTAP